MKEQIKQWTPQKYKNHQELLQAAICQKLEILKESDRFLDTYNPPKFSHETEQFNRSISKTD